MIHLKTEKDLLLLRESGRRLARIIGELSLAVRSGVSTRELDTLAERLIVAGGDRSAFKHYQPEGAPVPYPASLCVSINEEVVHGIPSERELSVGDVVTLDLGLNHQGYFTDMAVTMGVGEIAPEAEKLISATKESLMRGIAAARPGKRLGDVGSAVSAVLMAGGYGVVKELSGHGVGFAPHEEPYVPNYGRAGKGLLIEPGLVVAIEPMATLGTGDVALLADGYTFESADGTLSAHFEHTVAITERGPEILTLPN
jgi:methionyl aminopeptidase